MNEHDFGRILLFVRERMSELGFEALDERIASDLRIDPGDPSHQVQRYLRALRSEMLLESSATVDRLGERFNEIARTEDGQPIEPIVNLMLSDIDRERYGMPDVDLEGVPGVQSLINEIDQLASALADSRDPE